VGDKPLEYKTLDLLEKMYIEFSKKFESMDKRFDKMDQRFDKMDQRFDSLEKDVTDIKQRVIKIENDHGKNLQVLFDGYVQNSEKLDRIEKEVTKHEEIILRRVK